MPMPSLHSRPCIAHGLSLGSTTPLLIVCVDAAGLVFLYSEQQKECGEGASLMERWIQGVLLQCEPQGGQVLGQLSAQLLGTRPDPMLVTSALKNLWMCLLGLVLQFAVASPGW